jgi:hypothetical protein
MPFSFQLFKDHSGIYLTRKSACFWINLLVEDVVLWGALVNGLGLVKYLWGFGY